MKPAKKPEPSMKASRQPVRRSMLAVEQERGGKRKSTAVRVLDDNKSIIDQMVAQTVSLNAFPQPYPWHQKSFTLELNLYPDFGTAHLRKFPYLQAVTAGREQQDMQLEIYELEAFAEGIMELVTITRERGFLRPRDAQ